MARRDLSLRRDGCPIMRPPVIPLATFSTSASTGGVVVVDLGAVGGRTATLVCSVPFRARSALTSSGLTCTSGDMPYPADTFHRHTRGGFVAVRFVTSGTLYWCKGSDR